jgi:hypothetical protein
MKMLPDVAHAGVRRGSAGDGHRFPDGALGKARVRTIVASTHMKAQLDTALEVLR